MMEYRESRRGGFVCVLRFQSFASCPELYYQLFKQYTLIQSCTAVYMHRMTPKPEPVHMHAEALSSRRKQLQQASSCKTHRSAPTSKACQALEHVACTLLVTAHPRWQSLYFTWMEMETSLLITAASRALLQKAMLLQERLWYLLRRWERGMI